MLVKQLRVIIAQEDFPCRQHFKQTATQRVQIGFSRYGVVADDLFGGHVRVSSNRHALGTQVASGQITSNPKVTEFDLAIECQE